MKTKKNQKVSLTTVAAACLAATISTAQASTDTSEGTKEFLSDPHRVGTLAGSILGGVLTAHPAGTVAGSIIGYVVGKSSAFKSQEEIESGRQPHYARRSIIPKSEETVIAAKTEEKALTSTEPTTKPDMVASGKTDEILEDIATIKGLLKDLTVQQKQREASIPEQIASYCYGNQDTPLNPRLMSICYYHQSSS